ncbi:FH1/FH2 domain-containing protein 3 isoform X3 [Salarias fasciatus]|uniref:FH1/FH2 domain-containing protein 3 isoform X3 n=1 Tax=Salarias fasciatus TaxID=181472 RepID=UPI001176C2B6|nr:FH1/FH2 domain-containing protein 3-like isoform X3 [Salarias fasciatus]
MTRFGIQTIWAALEPVHLDTNRLEYLFESKGGSGGYSVLSGRQKQPAVSGAGGEAQQHRHHRPQQPAAAPPPPPAILSMDSSVLDREDVQRLSSGDPDRRGDGSDPRGQSPEPPLPPGPGRALPAHAGRHPSPELQAAALGLRSGLRLLGEGDRRASLPSEAGHGAAGGQPHLQVHPGHRAGRRQFPQRCKARVFELSYLGKLSQVRDTHTRQPLLHHVCELLLQLYPQSSDLYSEIPAVTKAGKCDYQQVQASFTQLQALCRTSWEQLKVLEKAERQEERRREETSRGLGPGGVASSQAAKDSSKSVKSG